MEKEVKLPALPLAYVLACRNTQGLGRGQLVVSHVQARVCQQLSSRANISYPMPATVLVRRNPRQAKPLRISENTRQRCLCLSALYLSLLLLLFLLSCSVIDAAAQLRDSLLRQQLCHELSSLWNSSQSFNKQD